MSTNAPTNTPAKLTYLFSSEVSRESFVQFIADVCDLADGWYTYDQTAFRRVVYKNTYEAFAREIEPHCKAHLRHMVIRIPTFSSLMVLISHICEQHAIQTQPDTKSKHKKKWLRLRV
jgi:hypothetical protein